MKMKSIFSFCYIVNFLLVFVCFICYSKASDDHPSNSSSTNKTFDNLTLCVKPHLVKISISDQEILIDRAEEECTKKGLEKPTMDPNKCPIHFDSIQCWPETPVNSMVVIKCPNYINKFNKKHKASKFCMIDPETSMPVWSRSNYSLCLKYEEKDFCNSTVCAIENHINYMVVMRVCGYITSMFSLTLSIVILLRPKLRCPRNYVHINLFLAFAFRTILVILSDTITKANPYSQRKHFLTDSDIKHEKDMTLCRVTVSIFRYSGSIYHMAIFSEAIYLVLLLKFPYYNELRGSKFCIVISWILPVLWNLPWILSRIFEDNYWCWQSESNYNLILKIPHSLIYILNVCCAVYIIRILYSKMRNRNMSREKIMKYRRLAKSILIIIPIFGLHFVFFAWIPYLSLFDFDIGPCFEMTMVYIETFFNAFQGLVVSVVCCFIHREVRIEFILYMCHILKKIKFLQSLRCLNSDYIRQMRYFNSEARAASIAGVLNTDNAVYSPSDKPRFSKHSLTNIEEENPMIYSNSPKKQNKLKTQDSIEVPVFESRKSFGSPSVLSYSTESRCCFCLFGDQKNDFFAEPKSNGKNKRFLLKLKSTSSDKKRSSRLTSTSTDLGNSLLMDKIDYQIIQNDKTPQETRLKSIMRQTNLEKPNSSNALSEQNVNITSSMCSSDHNLDMNKSISTSSENEKTLINTTISSEYNDKCFCVLPTDAKRASTNTYSSNGTADHSHLLNNSLLSHRLSDSENERTNHENLKPNFSLNNNNNNIHKEIPFNSNN